MRKWLTLLITIVILISTASYAYVILTSDNSVQEIKKTPPVTETVKLLPPERDEVLRLINEERSKLGLKKLKSYGELDATATAKAKDMAAEDYYDHVNPKSGKRGIQTVFERLGTYCYKASENIAAVDTSEEVVEDWIESPPHRVAMLDPKHDIAGLGIAKEESYYYVVLHLCDTN